ncbi:hypothetical protein ACWDAZ_33545 [Streptomyces sp. NPDC001215]
MESHVRCTRCDRYICPDCMREALREELREWLTDGEQPARQS